MVLAAGDLLLAYIGGLVWSFLALLAYFGGSTKVYSSAYLGDATLASWLSWPGARLFGWLGGFRSSGPLLLALLVPRRLILGLLGQFNGASACDVDHVLGRGFDGPEGHGVLLLHPAQSVFLVD